MQVTEMQGMTNIIPLACVQLVLPCTIQSTSCYVVLTHIATSPLLLPRLLEWRSIPHLVVSSQYPLGCQEQYVHVVLDGHQLIETEDLQL